MTPVPSANANDPVPEEPVPVPRQRARALIDKAWRAGDLRYKLHAGQRIVWDTLGKAKSKLFVINCSRQWGKSRGMVTRAVARAASIPKYRIKYAAAFRDDLKEFIIPHFESVLEDCPEDLRPRWVASQNKYVFPNGSEIKLIGIDKNPNGLRGNTIDEIYLDECGFMAGLKKLYRSVIMPATMHRPEAKIVMISTPPETPDHDYTEFALRARAEGNYAEFTIYDNPLITPDVIELLMAEAGGADSTDWKREYLCQFVVDENLAIFPEWSPDAFVKELPLPAHFQYFHKYVAMDLGIRDLTVVLFAYYDFTEAKVVVMREHWVNGPRMTTDQLAEDIRRVEKEAFAGYQPYLRVSDNNNLLLLNDLSIKHKLNFMPTSKDTLDAMVNNARLWVKDGRVIVHPSCEQLKSCLRYGIWQENRRDFARSAVFGHFDAAAALIYLLRNIDVFTNPIPANLGRTRHEFFMHNQPSGVSALSTGELELARMFGITGSKARVERC